MNPKVNLCSVWARILYHILLCQVIYTWNNGLQNKAKGKISYQSYKF